MKPIHTLQFAAGTLFCLALNISLAANTDLGDTPLASATTTAILPNVALIVDDSGSMDWEFAPDSISGSSSKYCYKWQGYNRIFYNPSLTYRAPIKADGTRYPDASFNAALEDGYFANGDFMYDGSTTNTITDLLAKFTPDTIESYTTFPSFSKSHRVTSVKVTLLNGTVLELLNTTPAPSSGTTNPDTIGSAVADAINAKTSTGFTAVYNTGSNILTILAPSTQAGLATTPSITTEKTSSSGSLQTVSPSAFTTVTHSSYVYYSTHKTSAGPSTSCAANSNFNTVTNPSNIAAPNVTTGSAAALTNYANWYSYYRKRAFLMKAAAGEAFAKLDYATTASSQDKYRVGLFFINSIESGQGSTNNDLAINTFTGTSASSQRGLWFDRLYHSRMDGGTPLREALRRAGQMYAGKVSGWDPVQYSCQRNYAILTTDGYWNSGNNKYGPLTITSGGTTTKVNACTGATTTSIGDCDGMTGVTVPSYDPDANQNMLADVAYYYYHTDLRTEALGNCLTAAGKNVCENNVPPAGTNANVDDVATHQHMTTYTIGLGLDGTMTYQDNYKTSTSGSYYNILNGGSWGTDKIDDLWHTAVDGRGTYFSAKNATSMASSLSSALLTITSATGAGAAAATSNLEPVSGDNFIYIANYQTLYWTGELSAYTIDLSTSQISSTSTWAVSPLLLNKIAADGNSDTRTIYTYSTSTTNKLRPFLWGNLSGTEQGYFSSVPFSSTNGLTQYSSWSSADQAAATGATLVNYLRGQDHYEDQARDASYGSYNRLYRDRQSILGDIVHSQPVYVGVPYYEFLDTGYSSFKSTNSTRSGTVYVAANDGMLHAFNATDGTERWAYIPPILLPDLWHLADKSYGTNHRYYMDGPISVSDILVGSTWKTILVGSLGKGGRGIYALDITDPASPKALWNYTSADNANLGYTYGAPIITKLGNGTWVVVIGSGYNNVSPGDGQGHVFVLDASTGSLLKTLETGVGSATTPSGLAYLNIKVNDFQKDNTALQAYGGDLYGNLWRFNLDAANGSAGSKVMALGSTKPITVAPEIGDIDDNTVLFFGTGEYLGTTDLATTGQQSFFAVKDNGSTTVATANLTQRTVTVNADKTRTFSGSAPDWSSSYGWYFNLPTSGERVNLAAQLYFGTILFSSTIPSATECQPGGYSILYALDYSSGLKVTGASTASWVYSSPLVGITVTSGSSGTSRIIAIPADSKIETTPPTLPISTQSSSGDSGRRVMWREILN